MAVVISAMVAGLVGFFYASYIRYIDPDLMIQPSPPSRCFRRSWAALPLWRGPLWAD